MIPVLQGLVTGLVVGAAFGVLRLTPPAPINWSGVAGIVGIVAGWMIFSNLVERLA